jgi:hypothetical protein
MPGKCDGGAWRVMDPKSFACFMNSYSASSVRVSLSPSREQSSCHAILFGYLSRSTAHCTSHSPAPEAPRVDAPGDALGRIGQLP